MKVADIPALVQAPKDQGRSHEYFFAEFCKYEKACGGPDPQIALVGEMSKDLPFIDRAWNIGCYAAVYNVPGAWAIWKDWPWERICSEADALEGWIRGHWEGITFRRERRAVRSVGKLTRCLLSYASWISQMDSYGWWGGADYDAAWKEADRIYGMGRYVNLKLLEALRRYCGAGVELKDLRAAGGWSPRATLALLYPGHAQALLGTDTRDNCRIADMTARWAQETLAERYGISATMFEVQVLLCEYKEAAISRRQYPGRSHDSELKYAHLVEGSWDTKLTDFYSARKRIFPEVSLGEVQGWDGPREELGDVIPDFGYVWSDLRYDFNLNRDNLAQPVLRLGALQAGT